MKNKNKFLRKALLGFFLSITIFSSANVFAADENQAERDEISAQIKTKENELADKEKECLRIVSSSVEVKEAEDCAKAKEKIEDELLDLRVQLLNLLPPEQFEVALETPFTSFPGIDEVACGSAIGEDDSDLCVDKNGNFWRKKIRNGRIAAWEQVVRGKDGNEILADYSGLLYKFIGGFIGLIAVLMLVIGGIQVSVGGMDEEKISKGKERIISALVGLTLVFLSGLILYTVNPTFFSSQEKDEEEEIDLTYEEELKRGDYSRDESSEPPQDTPPAVQPAPADGLDRLTHTEAIEILGNEFQTNKTNCRERRTDKNCTSLDDVRERTIRGLFHLKNEICEVDSSGVWVITGGTECVHDGNKTCTLAEASRDTGESHGNGYKIDIRPSPGSVGIDNCISNEFQRDGSVGIFERYKFIESDGFSYTVLNEGDHWDIKIL